jgi:transposase
LRQIETPDDIEKHAPGPCVCGHVFGGQEPERIERYQVVDIPKPRAWVTEHQVEVACCPQCGRVCKGTLPPGVSRAPVQYGPGVLSLAVYLRVYQLLPYERISQLCEDVFGLSLSKATIEAAEARADGELEPFVEALKAALTEAPVLHADETGIRVENDTRWLHVLATAQETLYQVHDKRGGEAMDALGILPAFDGTLIHDCWKPYFKYDCTHGLCNAHLLRELKFAHEELGQAWALEMFELLLYLYGVVAGHGGAPFSREALASISAIYEDILARGIAHLPPDPPKTGSRGRPKKSKARNLHERLATHQDSVLLFVRDPKAPFTNNVAEQAVRMAKVQQKISGCMRTVSGAQRFARLRSYVSTVKKHGENIFQQITAAISGVPLFPSREVGYG